MAEPRSQHGGAPDELPQAGRETTGAGGQHVETRPLHVRGLRCEKDDAGRTVLVIPPAAPFLKVWIDIGGGIKKKLEVPTQKGSITITVMPNLEDPDIWNADGFEMRVGTRQGKDPSDSSTPGR